MRALLLGLMWLLAATIHASQPIFMAHYMPWFETQPKLGWHWTMDRFDPAKGELASHYRPLIGPYASNDPHVIEYHLLTMKQAGIDGVILDWYGIIDHFDYTSIHRSSARVVHEAGRLGMKVAVCYEDQTIPKLVEAKKLENNGRVAHARETLNWLEKRWFPLPHYLRLEGQPVLLSFGFSGLTDDEWSETLKGKSIRYFSEHRRREGAFGAFDWPVPKDYPGSLDRFYKGDIGVKMPVVCPRFEDVYETSYGKIPDDQGRVLAHTLKLALESKSPIVQIATWNDWGEGTQIEPSKELGYRDLEIIQKARGAKGDLRLPHRLYLLRKAKPEAEMDPIAKLIADGEDAKARAAIEKIERS